MSDILTFIDRQPGVAGRYFRVDAGRYFRVERDGKIVCYLEKVDGYWYFSQNDGYNGVFSIDELQVITNKLKQLNKEDEHNGRDIYRERIESALVEKDGTATQGA